MTDWAPATEAEAAMQEALHADDQEQYFRILARVDLLLPVSSEAIAGRAPMGWGTWTAGGRTHVLAFTSAEAMYACLAEHAGSARKMPYHELAAAWPNLEWWLAVDPGLPIEGYLPAWFVSQLARGDARLPGRQQPAEPAERLGRARAAVPPQSRSVERSSGQLESTATGLAGQPGHAAEQAQAAGVAGAAAYQAGSGQAEPAQEPAQPAIEPANELERQLIGAVTAGRMDHFLSTLLLAKVLLPVADGADPQLRPGEPGFHWRAEKLAERFGETAGDQFTEGPHVVVYSSPERLVEQLGEQVPWLEIRFVQLIRSWPEESWPLSVNPGTPITMTLPGSQIARLASSVEEVGLGDDAGVAGESGASSAERRAATRAAVEQPVEMQKVVAPSQVTWYLERSYDRVSGFVHRAHEVAHLRGPAKLVAGLGLRFDGSPFGPDDSEIYVLRWPAYRPGLYRIPYGGRTEAAMAAMEGWVIERAPFRGNGFAPAESEDVIAEFKVDSIRLPHGAQLWRLRADGSSQLVALLESDGPSWRRVEEEG